MLAKRLLAAAAAICLTAAPVLAQTPAPGVPQPTRPTVAAPAPTAQASPIVKKVNLNTATATELDALPEVGQARGKVILTERAKGPFKDWADFDKRMTGTSVNAGVKAKIKNLVTF